MPRARRKPPRIVDAADYGTPERHRHGGIDLVAVRAGSGKHVTHAARVRRECWLDTYLERGVISETEHEAGLKFRAYSEKARLLRTALAIDYSRAGRGQSMDTPLAVIMASERLTMLRDVLSPEEWQVIEGVCGHGESVTAAAGTRRNNAVPRLRAALDQAARVWGIR